MVLTRSDQFPTVLSVLFNTIQHCYVSVSFHIYIYTIFIYIYIISYISYSILLFLSKHTIIADVSRILGLGTGLGLSGQALTFAEHASLKREDGGRGLKQLETGLKIWENCWIFFGRTSGSNLTIGNKKKYCLKDSSKSNYWNKHWLTCWRALFFLPTGVSLSWTVCSSGVSTSRL